MSGDDGRSPEIAGEDRLADALRDAGGTLMLFSAAQEQELMRRIKELFPLPDDRDE